MEIRPILCLALLFLILLGSTFVFSQGTTAAFTGTVSDPTGALVTGAEVTITSTDMVFERHTVSGKDGGFVFPSLPPGKYSVQVRTRGFATADLKDVVLQVGDQIETAIRLNVAGPTEIVSVSDFSTIRVTPSVSTIVDQKFVDELPLNGRSFQSLIGLTPGMVFTKTNFQEQGQFSANGQRPNANYFTVDGVSANIHVSVSARLEQTGGGSIPGVSASGGTSNLVSMDALQEFRIQTSTFAPEFGRTPGAQVSIVTRSGNNRFQGTAFEYLRNDVFDAKDWFANKNGLSKPALRQNDFGGVLGGPILRNHTYFFGSYEGLRLRQPQTRVTDVPSLTTRQNALASMQPYMNAYSLPTGPDTTNGWAQFAASYSDPSSLDAFSVRVDHNFGSRLALFGRYDRTPSELQVRAVDNTSINTVTNQHFYTTTGTVGGTANISPKMLNDLRLNWSRTRSNWYSHLDDFGSAVPPENSAWFLSSLDPGTSLMVFRPAGTASEFYVGRNVDNRQAQFNLVESFSVTAGSHQLKFGFDYRRLSPVLGIRNYSQFVVFTGATTMAAGKVSSGYVETYDPAPLLFRNYSTYAQDTWKISPRLTLTYGLRWDVNTPPSAQEGKQLYKGIGVDDPATMTVGPGDIYETKYANFAPRIGASYAISNVPGQELMVRGGIGIFYDLGTGPAGNVASNFPNAVRNAFPPNTTYPLDPAIAAPPPLRTTPPVGVFGFRAFEPGLALPRTYQWNFTLERSFGAEQSALATYVGAVGRKLLRSQLIPNPGPNIGGNVTLVDNSATSDYHALQLQFLRRLRHGLQGVASYTWSHSIDIASSDSSSMVRGDMVDPLLDRASSDFDIRHSFSGALTWIFPQARVGAFGSALLNDWSTDVILAARSSEPVNVTTGVSNLYGVSPRPNVVPGTSIYLYDGRYPGGKVFNRAAFAAPPANTQGNLGRNALRAFAVWQLDFSLQRQFPIGERLNLQFRAEMFNVLNHPNFGDPVGQLSSGFFGQSDRTFGRTLSPGGGAGFNPLYQIGGPRSMQMALRLRF